MKKNLRLTFVLNLIITVLVIAGMVIIFTRRGQSGILLSGGWLSLRYYTTLSNVFCGLTGLLTCIRILRSGRLTKPLFAGKLMTSAATGLTFLVVLLFFGPLYGLRFMYMGSNFLFHLVVPLLALVDFFLLPFPGGGKTPFRFTLLAALPTVVYGVCYALNLFINGIGEWPYSNDWYGFVNWGYPIGFTIFGIFIVVTWLFAWLLWGINRKLSFRNQN